MLRQTTVENGILQGIPCGDPRVTVFKGIPYAKPPVGNLRWRPPEPAENWTGIRKADTFAPISYQNKPGSDLTQFYTKEINPLGYECEMSEDSLYLNIWTPAQSTEENLPVYLWIHGGGMVAGYSWEMEFDGERMARQGIIFATIGYRLNIFGFLAHKQLAAECPNGGGTNFGLQDCVAGIKWLNRNIAAFGGDPNNITIGGQSAGAMCTLSMFTSPLTKGLISKVITQSGGGLRSIGYQRGCVPLAEAEQSGDKFLKMLKVETVEEARKLDAKMIFDTFQELMKETGRPNAIIDGYVLTEDPTDTMLADKHPRIPYLYGSNKGEVAGTPAAPVMPQSIDEFKQVVQKIFGAKADEFLALCNIKTMDDVKKIMRSDTFNTRTFGARVYDIVQADQKRNNYTYIFDLDIPGSDNPGSYHGSELWFVFNSINRCWRPFEGRHYDWARRISGYWVNFIKTGNPNGVDINGESLPEWRFYSKDDPFIMEFAGEKPRQLTGKNDPLTEYRIKFHLGRT